MLEPAAALAALLALLPVGFTGWLANLAARDVSIVDSLWSLLFLLAVVVYATMMAGEISRRGHIVLALVAVWAVRLSAYITWRSHGQPEDRRYAAMRQRNNPGFEWKSRYMSFGLQAVFAGILAAPLAGAVSGVALLEKDIAQRRPAYRDYIARTNAFIPGPPR